MKRRLIALFACLAFIAGFVAPISDAAIGDKWNIPKGWRITSAGVLTPTTDNTSTNALDMGSYGITGLGDLTLDSGSYLYFRDTSEYIVSANANELLINAETILNLAISEDTRVRLWSTIFAPARNDIVALGSTSLMWSDLFLASGGVVNFNNGDATITHSTGKLNITAAGTGADDITLGSTVSISDHVTMTAQKRIYLRGTSEYIVSQNANELVLNAGTIMNLGIAEATKVRLWATILAPAANDGVALGSTSLMWSDLFLADGGVINWNNSDVTITHSTNAIGVAGGTLTAGAGLTVVGTLTLPASSITTSMLNTKAVTTEKIENLAVTTAKLGNYSVYGNKINNKGVGAGKIDDGVVNTTQLANYAVTTAKLNTKAVTTEKIFDQAVTWAKIADGVVNSDKLTTNAVTSVKITNLAVTGAKIANATITSGKMAALSISTGSLIDASVKTAKINNQAVTQVKLAPLAVATGNIIAKAVTTAKIEDYNVTATQIASDAVIQRCIADGNVGTAQLANLAVATGKIAMNAVDWTKTSGLSYDGAISGITNITIVNGLVTAYN